MKTCRDCKNEWTGKGTLCNTCKSRARRNKDTVIDEVSIIEGTLVDAIVPTPRIIIESTPEGPNPFFKLTPTDQLFENANPGYYYMGGETRESKCRICNKKFTTSLKLLRFCSPDCMAAIEIAIAG